MFRAILVLAAVGTLSAQNSQQNLRQRASTPAKPEDLGSISGQVINGATGEPLNKTAVTALSPFSTISALSDANGQFSLAGVEPGSYRLSATRNGFVRQEYGARAPERPGTALTVVKAQRVTEITLKLTPQAVIAGRITDEDGRRP